MLFRSSTPKKEKQERLSKHKENLQHSQAEEEATLLGQQRVFYDRNCRAFRRKVMLRRQEFEQEQIREVRMRWETERDGEGEKRGGRRDWRGCEATGLLWTDLSRVAPAWDTRGLGWGWGVFVDC